MHTLEIQQVTKRYGHDVVVDDLSFTVRPGRVTGFLGPNGAGKSTTMKILLDLASADHGHASIGGTRYRDLADPARTVGVVLEPNAFHPGRSGRNHLRVLADGAGHPHGAHRRAARDGGTGARRATGASAPTRWACGNGSAWPPHCSATHPSWSSTNPATDSTPKASAGSATCCANAPRPATPSSSPATCSTRSSTWPTSSW